MTTKYFISTVRIIVKIDKDDVCDPTPSHAAEYMSMILSDGQAFDWAYSENEDGTFTRPIEINIPDDYEEGDAFLSDLSDEDAARDIQDADQQQESRDHLLSELWNYGFEHALNDCDDDDPAEFFDEVTEPISADDLTGVLSALRSIQHGEDQSLYAREKWVEWLGAYEDAVALANSDDLIGDQSLDSDWYDTDKPRY
jgi:hypothetical protein